MIGLDGVAGSGEADLVTLDWDCDALEGVESRVVRFLGAILALQRFQWILRGDICLQSRREFDSIRRSWVVVEFGFGDAEFECLRELVPERSHEAGLKMPRNRGLEPAWGTTIWSFSFNDELRARLQHTSVVKYLDSYKSLTKIHNDISHTIYSIPTVYSTACQKIK